MTKDLLIIGAVVALVAIMILAALPEITSAMPEVYYVEPTEPETAVEAKAETVLQSTANIRYALTAAELEDRKGRSTATVRIDRLRFENKEDKENDTENCNPNGV